MEMDGKPAYAFQAEEPPSGVVIAGVSQFGLAGLTAVDFLADHLELAETGHLIASGLPTLTPFEAGRPRHHTRLMSRTDLDVTVLLGELFVPPAAADGFADAAVEWLEDNDVTELTVLSGVPIPHGPSDHRTFYVATEDYRERRLADEPVPPMGSGFLDGVAGALVQRGLDGDLAVGVFVTPVHAQMPDVEAAVRLVSALEDCYGLGVDTGPLEEFGEEVAQHYAELQAHIERRAEEGEARLSEDRMFM